MSDIQDKRPHKRQRNRQTLVCRACRARKVKCDRGTPCGPCQKTQSQCSYSSLNPISLPHHPLQDISGISTASPQLQSAASRPNYSSPLPAKSSGPIGEACQFFRHDGLQRQLEDGAAEQTQDPFVVNEPCMAGPPKSTNEFHRTKDGTFSKTRLFGRSHWMHSLSLSRVR